MATKDVLESLELIEAKAAEENNKLHWQPSAVAENISRSLRSLDSVSNRSDTSNNPLLLDPKHLGHASNKSSLFGNSKDSRDFSGSQESFFKSTANSSVTSYGLLASLKPHESLPDLDSFQSSTESKNSPHNAEERKHKKTPKSKMADDEPEVDYGMTLRNDVENNPDYDFVGRKTTASGNNGGARPKTDVTPPNRNKAPAGGVRLPFGSDSSGTDSSARPQWRRGEREKARESEPRAYPESIPAQEVKDLSKLSNLREDTINACLEARYKENLIYTRCGDVMISVNPFKDLGIYSKKIMGAYNHISISDDPHLYMISAKAYQGLRDRKTDQVILVSGESGAGKTEATKLLVQHLISMAGSDEMSLQEKIIQVNPLLENFGNAKTVLNNNSSRFAKFLKLNYNEDAVVQSAKIQDFMLEKSRVVHYQEGETTYHSFYALLAGLKNPLLYYINPGQTFRITGDFSSLRSTSVDKYREMYTQQQKIFQLIDMEQEEREDVDVILAAILHIGEIEFEDDINDCVIVKNEDTVQKVANLLDLDNEKLTKALIERRGKVGKDEFIQFSKKKRQAEDERDAIAKTLYEKLFGWIVRKINDALKPTYGGNCGSIGILDICGFEDVGKNTFEQLCINIINEHLQNFMNKKVIQDERDLYEKEGIGLGDIDTKRVNNDDVLDMFTKKCGILDSIDEDSKVEVASDDVKMVRKLDAAFKGNKLYIPATSNRPEFSIQHFAGQVKYDGRSFIQKNCDSLGDLVDECLKDSGSLLVKDLFLVTPWATGSISMSPFKFRGSRRGGHSQYPPVEGTTNLSQSINQSRRASLKSRFGSKMPSFKSDMANKTTHIHYFKNSLDELHRNMVTANPYFVRCIKPNDYLKCGKYNKSRVLTQLKYNGVTEIARIRSCGLPIRMPKTDFIQRYGDLVPKSHNDDDLVEKILESFEAEPPTYKVGNSQVFMTSQVQSSLEQDLSELRRIQEEERKRQEEERRRREEQEERARAEREKILIAQRKKEEEILEKQRELDRKKEEFEKKREEKEREIKEKEREELKSALKKTDNMTLQQSFQTTLGKSVLFNETIQESPTPDSSIRDGSVSAGTDTGSSSSQSIGSSGPHALADSTNTVTTEVSDYQDGDTDDTVSYDSEWVDHFQELTEEEVREDLSDLRTLKVIKVILYIFLALLLLISLVVQKVSFITLAKNLPPKWEKTNETEPVEPDRGDPRQIKKTYYMLVLMLIIPYAVGFILSVLKLLFGISKSPSVWTWVWVLSIECLHTMGMCLLVFRVLREVDFFAAAYLLSATVFIPSLLKLFISDRKEDFNLDRSSGTTSWKVAQSFGFVADLLAFGIQCSALVLVFERNFYKDNSNDKIFEMVGGLILASVNQWENFSDGTLCGIPLNEESWFKNKVLKIRYELQECRNYPNSLAYPIKIGLTILLTYLLAYEEDDIKFTDMFDALKYSQKDDIQSVNTIIAVTISAFVAFNTSLLSLKLQMQRFSFALPLCLATPITIVIFFLGCEGHLSVISDFSEFSTTITNNTEACTERVTEGDWPNLVMASFWFLSLLTICRHIWRRQLDKNSNMNRLFLNPVYCGALTTEQIMLNQRRHQCRVNMLYKFEENDVDLKSVWYKINRLATFQSEGSQESQQQRAAAAGKDNAAENGPTSPNNNTDEPETQHVTPKIYACATMWHETRTEMVQLLKSLHRLDLDQYLRKINQRPSKYDPNYYEYEAHIFFDDAMERDDENFPVPNRWVKDLVGAMTEACSSVHCKPMKIHDPVKMVTPYGGQLLWKMPGENLLFVHLKDMSKIRNRKRWSQVMYMYYLLHYRLSMFCQQEALRRLETKNRRVEGGLNIDEINMFLGEEHTARSNKTFVLALDGDTDFLPSSIRILMQRMDEENVGATCGRIHPIGKGPMVWYQKFEYAIGHWLQKSAEHVFGCVLCSPGCFSLFRAKALMDANVVKRYTTEPSEPSHHLQYDQGEDRWLCTLLLQRGYRIEYAAGADAWTFAPEGFFEFFNQRRRWMPSTIANILDLLGTADRTRKINSNISLPYVLYTWLLMVMTLLGPGTILMMMAGAFQLIFTLDIEWAYFWSIIPALLFTIACFWLKTKWQLLIAAALSIGYGFIMVIVIVGTIITATTENIFHPSVIIMVGLLAIFLLTGMCHPKEWACLTHGILYLLCIPSGYLLLVIYSICNLNDVSWGTREVPTKAQLLEIEAKKKKKEEEKRNKKKKSFFKRMFDSSERTAAHISELTNLLRTVVPKAPEAGKSSIPADQNVVQLLSAIESNTRELLQKQNSGEVSGSKQSQARSTTKPASSSKAPGKADVPTKPSALAASESQGKPADKKPARGVELDPLRPRWTQDKGLGKGCVIVANKEEIRFWNGLVEKYLLPIRPDAAEKKKIADGLKDLRNSAAFAFILVNLLWMSLNFMFQLTEAAKVHLTYEFGQSKYEVEESVLGMSFVFLLLVLLLLQFAGMVVHRMGTLQQLLSTTKIWGKNEDVNISDMDEIEDTIRLIKLILQVPVFNDEGMTTEPPVATDKENPLGLSVKAPEDDYAPMPTDLSSSVKALGKILDATNKGSFIDAKSAATLAEVKKRLGGSRIRDRLSRAGGTSFRPTLPPRNQFSSTHKNSTWLSSQGNFGMTKKDLEKLRPRATIIEPNPVLDLTNAQWKALGALGRSLNQRAKVISEEQASLRAHWTDNDVASVPRVGGRRAPRATTRM